MIKQSLKKLFSVFLSISLVLLGAFALSPVNTNAVSADVSFDIGGNGSGTVEYKIGNGEWTIVSNGGYISELTSGNTISIKATPASGEILDTHENQNTITIGNNSAISIYDSLSTGSYTFEYTGSHCLVQIRFDHGSNPGGGDSGNPGQPGGGLEAGKYEIRVDQEVAGQNGTVSVLFLDSSSTAIGSAINATGNVDSADIPSGAAYVRVSVDNASADILNNARLESFPRPTDNTPSEVDLIDDIRQSGFSTQPIDPATKGYQIKVIFSNTMSVSWSYDSATAAPDQLVEHARIELLNSDNPTDYKDYGKTDWQLTIGETYYFVLIPDYGYQVSSLNINGQPIQPMNSVGVFSFVMSHSNFHFQGIVTPTEDITEFNQNGLLDDLAVNAENAVDSGNVRLTETDVAPDTASLSVVGSSEASLFGTIDLSLDQIISKGNGQYWETNLTDLAAPVTIATVVPAGELSEGQTYTVVRNHNGVYQEMNAAYYPDGEWLVFESDAFSTFSIIKKPGETASGSPSSGSEKPLPSLSDSVGGVSVTNWTEFNNVVTSNPASVNKSLVELTLNYQTAVIPADVFKNVSNTKAIGIHLFVGDGCALTFLNGGKIADQSQIDLSCTTSESTGLKAVKFNSYSSLTAPVIYHNIVPAGTKSVRVYFTGSDGARTLISTQSPTAAGRFCFPITKLGLYEMEY